MPSNTLAPAQSSSPGGSPPSKAVHERESDTIMEQLKSSRQVSIELKNRFESRSRDLIPETDPGEDLPEVDAEAEREVADLGIQLARHQKQEIRLEKEALNKDEVAGLVEHKDAKKRRRELDEQYFSTGEQLWHHEAKKVQLSGPGIARIFEPNGDALAKAMLSLYRKSDGHGSRGRKRPSRWRQGAEDYYDGGRSGDATFCHVSGEWTASGYVKAAHIVPCFFESEDLGGVVFGERAPSLKRAGNSLLMSLIVKTFFDTYRLLIVPVDATESPIKRYKVDIISPDIRNVVYGSHHHSDGRFRTIGDLDGKELTFRNDKRPVARFMYFHLIMALVRIKDIERPGWQNIWAKYHQQRPFPTPGRYMRRSMLLALATHFGTTDVDAVDSWIQDHGFDSPLSLTNAETVEVARRFHKASEERESQAEKLLIRCGEDEDEDEEDEEDEEADNENSYVHSEEE